jgi:hypothetical protein
LLLVTVSCGSSKLPDPDEEAQQFAGLVNKYCQKNNLAVKGYLGKTIIRSKNNYKTSDVGKEPIVYEWKVMNKASKKEFVLWVGPVLPQFPNLKPQVSLGKDRYTMQGVKIKEQ